MQQKGFSFAKIMVVIAIIGMVAALAIPTFNNYFRKAKTASETAEKAKAGKRSSDKSEYRRSRKEYRSTKEKLEQLKLECYFAEQTILTAGAHLLDAKTDAERKKMVEDIEKCNRFLRDAKGQIKEYEEKIKIQQAKMKEPKDRIKASGKEKRAEADSGKKDEEKAKEGGSAFRDAVNRAEDAYSSKKKSPAKAYVETDTYFPQLGYGTGVVNPAPQLPDDTHGQEAGGSTCSGD